MLQIPGTTAKLRFFQRVDTVDPQYDIYDVGIQHEDDGIDSLAVGGSFYTLKNAIAEANAKAMQRSADKKKKKSADSDS